MSTNIRVKAKESGVYKMLIRNVNILLVIDNLFDFWLTNFSHHLSHISDLWTFFLSSSPTSLLAPW